MFFIHAYPKKRQVFGYSKFMNFLHISTVRCLRIQKVSKNTSIQKNVACVSKKYPKLTCAYPKVSKSVSKIHSCVSKKYPKSIRAYPKYLRRIQNIRMRIQKLVQPKRAPTAPKGSPAGGGGTKKLPNGLGAPNNPQKGRGLPKSSRGSSKFPTEPQRRGFQGEETFPCLNQAWESASSNLTHAQCRGLPSRAPCAPLGPPSWALLCTPSVHIRGLLGQRNYRDQ